MFEAVEHGSVDTPDSTHSRRSPPRPGGRERPAPRTLASLLRPRADPHRRRHWANAQLTRIPDLEREAQSHVDSVADDTSVLIYRLDGDLASARECGDDHDDGLDRDILTIDEAGTFHLYVHVAVRRLRHYSPGPRNGRSRSTARQGEAFETAVEAGCYEILRRVNQTELEGPPSCAPSTVDDHRRNAESKMCSGLVDPPEADRGARDWLAGASGDRPVAFRLRFRFLVLLAQRRRDVLERRDGEQEEREHRDGGQGEYDLLGHTRRSLAVGQRGYSSPACRSDKPRAPVGGGMGLASYLPKRAWALVLLLGCLAIGSLLVPYDMVGAPVGLSFEAFFVVVSAVQLTTALGIGATVVYYRRDEAETSEWRYE